MYLERVLSNYIFVYQIIYKWREKKLSMACYHNKVHIDLCEVIINYRYKGYRVNLHFERSELQDLILIILNGHYRNSCVNIYF